MQFAQRVNLGGAPLREGHLDLAEVARHQDFVRRHTPPILTEDGGGHARNRRLDAAAVGQLPVAEVHLGGGAQQIQAPRACDRHNGAARGEIGPVPAGRRRRR